MRNLRIMGQRELIEHPAIAPLSDELPSHLWQARGKNSWVTPASPGILSRLLFSVHAALVFLDDLMKSGV